MPAFDRTAELLLCFENVAPKIKVSTGKELRNRHRRERFAVEDHKSPDVREDFASDSDNERRSPPATFISEATSIFVHVVEAERLLKCAAKNNNLPGDDFDRILNLCLKRISTLQQVADDLAVDQHEAAIIWFLNHRVSNLTRDYENIRTGAEQKAKEASRVRLLRRTALASSRPLTTSPSNVPALSTESFAKEFDVSPEQMQMLAHENDALVKEYSDMRDAITNTQTSMNDIVRLQTTLQDQLLYQATQIDRLYDEATDTLETVRKANTHLNQAGGRQSTSVRFFLWFILLAAIFVLLLHVISD